MDEVKDLFNSINSKLGIILKQKIEAQSKSIRLEKEKSELETIICSNKNEITQLKEKENIIRTSRSINNTEKNTDVKLKINQLVREIDKCIAYLNR